MFQNATVALTVSVLAAIAFPVALVVALTVCLSCLDKLRKRPAGGFSNFNNGAETSNTPNAHINSSFTMEMEDTNLDGADSSAFSLEPLPDITAKVNRPVCPLRPRIGVMDRAAASDASLKLIVAHQPFPRSQIIYLKELGCGWFGKVIESEAEKITSGVPRSKVVVKMMKDDASKDEQQLFCEEVQPFRELEHPNIMRLLGQCMEISPMLMILEFAAFGNLKHYLRNHRHEQASLIHKNRLIQFAMDASKGLACLHAHDYVHRDLAARNCLVMSDHTVKIGDYGIAEDLYKEDYLTSGSDLLPIRWMAPESLKQENSTWTAAGFTKESDIWSLGVLLWEIAMLGERPYDMLTDEAVLQGVIVDRDIPLPQPDIPMPAKDRLYEVMRFCWLEPDIRLKVGQVYELLEQIASKTPEEGDDMNSFEQKWKHLMPNQRHESIDSYADQQGSESSDDSNILHYSDSNSLEDITSAGAKTPSPRATRRKLSVRRVTIPNADNESEEVMAAASIQQVQEKVPSLPQIRIEDEKNHQVKQPQQSKKADKLNSQSTEFTEFTSHSTNDDGSNAETPNVSQILLEKTAGVNNTFQVDALSKALVNKNVTPDRSQAQPKPRKTSTPMPESEASPTSSSSLSGAESSSSATFVTAPTSSPGYLTDAYTTASENTLVSDKSKPDSEMSSDLPPSGEVSIDSNMSIEILDNTAVPSNKSEEESYTPKVSDPFAAAVCFNKDAGYGEFESGSLMEENRSTTPKDSGDISAGGDSSEAASKPPTIKASSDLLVASAASELSAVKSDSVTKTAGCSIQEQVFPSLSLEVSSLSLLKTNSTITQQGTQESNIFAFDQPAEPLESENSGANLTKEELQKIDPDLDFSFDVINSIPDVAAVKSTEKGSFQAALDTADFSTIPLVSMAANPFASEGGSYNTRQQPNLFVLGGSSAPGLHDSSFEVIDTQDSTQASMSSSAFSDFDMLSSFSTGPPAPSGAPSDPFGGNLLQMFGGSSSSSVPVETKKESQDEVLLTNTPADQNKPPESSLLDFSEFQSFSTAESKQDEGKAQGSTTSGDNATAASLIDF